MSRSEFAPAPAQPSNTVDQDRQAGAWKLVLWTLAFQFAWSWRSIADIVGEGRLPGPDDFMRLIQVRGLIDGQGWFETIAPRMLPPASADIHWSRLVDAPLAGLIQLLTPLFGSSLAERMTAIVWPSALLVATVFVITAICERLAPRINRLLPVFFTVLCVSSLAQYVPGRIDHHNVQILGFVCMLWAVVSWHKPMANVAAGAVVALAISIGFDNLIFVVLLFAFVGLDWCLGDKTAGARMRRFALALGAGTLVLFVINIPPVHYFTQWCDAHSIVTATAQMVVAGGMIVLASASRLLSARSPGRQIAMRTVVGGIMAAGCIALLYALYPACAGGPYAALSGEAVERWLSQVSEAKALLQVLADYPEYWIKTVAYCAVIVAVGLAVLSRPIENRGLVALVFAAFVASVALSVVQYRTIRIGFFAAVPICVLATQMATRWLIERYGSRDLRVAAGQIAAIAILSTATWSFAGGALLGGEQTADNRRAGQATCFSESDFDRLDALETGHVLSDLNSAPAILVFTGHTVVVGPYHRNHPAIVDVLDFFLADEATARAIADKHAIDYVALCGSGDGGAEAGEPALADRIRAGDPPAWLERLSAPGDRLAVLRIIR